MFPSFSLLSCHYHCVTTEERQGVWTPAGHNSTLSDNSSNRDSDKKRRNSSVTYQNKRGNNKAQERNINGVASALVIEKVIGRT